MRAILTTSAVNFADDSAKIFQGSDEIMGRDVIDDTVDDSPILVVHRPSSVYSTSTLSKASQSRRASLKSSSDLSFQVNGT